MNSEKFLKVIGEAGNAIEKLPMNKLTEAFIAAAVKGNAHKTMLSARVLAVCLEEASAVYDKLADELSEDV